MAPRTSVSRECCYYLLVMAFIVGGAISRDVNLLYILAGMMIGPLLLNWRWITVMLRELELERVLPRRAYVGVPIHCELTVRNQQSNLDIWALRLEDQLQRIEVVTDGTHAGESASHAAGIDENSTSPLRGALEQVTEPIKVQSFVEHIAVGEQERGAYRFVADRRGRYRFGPIRATSRFPLGLIEGRLSNQQTQEMLIYPREGNLTRQFRELVGIQRPGQRRTSRQSNPAQGEFFALREWRRGDSRRWIHWRTSARIGELAVRQFERRSEGRLTIVVDLWDQPTATEPADTAPLERCVSFVATLVRELCDDQISLLRVTLHGNQTVRCEGAGTSDLLNIILDHLATIGARAPGDSDDHMMQALPRTPDYSCLLVTTRPLEQISGLVATISRESLTVVSMCDPNLSRYISWSEEP